VSKTALKPAAANGGCDYDYTKGSSL